MKTGIKFFQADGNAYAAFITGILTVSKKEIGWLKQSPYYI